MDVEKIKELLEEIRKKYPPHYPTKMHDVSEYIPVLLNTLENAVNYIGFSDANIAIKNIVAKCINQFLISVQFANANNIVNLNVQEESLGSGKRIKIFAEEDKNICLDLDFLEDGTIVVYNNYRCPVPVIGQNYSNSVISYNSLSKNVVSQSFTFKNKSLYQSISFFSDDGIEIKNDFKVIPKFRNFKTPDQCVFGFVQRLPDFYTVALKLNIVGEDFHGIISGDEISQINSLGEIVLPLAFLSSLDHDLNMLNPISELDMTSLGSGGFKNLAYNYLYYKYYSNDYFNEYCKDSEFIIENAYMLDLSPKSLKIISSSVVHAPYSKMILDNIKKLVRAKGVSK